MTQSKVAVVKTTPETVLDDYKKLMHLAEYQKYLPKDKDTALKINISWHHFYPACSTPPWQLEGVIKTLLSDGYHRELIHGCQNRTVVVSAKKGEIANKHKPVLEKYNLRNIHLYEGEEWISYEPKGKMLVLHDIFPQGIHLPKRMVGENIIHLPTMKTHVFTTMTGAMKNAFGGLLHEKRHWTHSVIHETLVDLLTIQKEIHSGIFAVMDGTFAGDGPGPRCMVPYVKDYLGCGDLREIEIVGEDISGVTFGFHGEENTLASRGQKLIYWGPLKPLENILLRTFIVPWSYIASISYHDWYWYPFIGRRRVKEMMNTGWGKLFQNY